MFVTTPRLLLRPPWPEDAPAIAAAVTEGVARMTGSLPWPYALEHAEQFVAVQREPSVTEASCLIVERRGGAIAGAIGFSRNKVNGVLELGYWLAEPFHGRGFATEAGRAWMQLAFAVLRLRELWAGHYFDNPASATVLAKLGFVPTGEVVDYPCTARGGTVPSPTYRATPATWRAAIGAGQ